VVVMARFEAAMRDMTEYPALGGGSDALFELGLVYCSGREVDIDLVAAHKWFNLAASRGNVEARRYRLEISGEMTRAEIAEAQKQAREWLAKH
jgi:TPR repeat protein